jgi:Flp pilus assembly protein TadG
VEGSIVLFLFLVLVIAILDFGQVLFLHHVLTERVRSGARYAAVHQFNTTTIQNVVAYNSTAATQNGVGLFGLTPAKVTVTRYDAGTPNDRIKVSISTYTMHFLSPWLPASFTAGPFSAVMPVESLGAAN